MMRRILTPLGLLLGAAASAAAQGPPALESLVERLAAMTAVSGYEQRLTDTLLTLLPGSTRDRAGNVLLRLGQGEPKTLIACPLDEPGYVVGGVRDDGYLTLRRVGRPTGLLQDQQLEGQRVTLWGRRGPVPAVVGVRSTHLTSGRPPLPDVPFHVDDAFVDLGTTSASQVRVFGIGVLTPVALAKRPHRYADSLIAAPVAGRRAACSALLRAAANARPSRGTLVVAFVVEDLFTRRGLLSLGRTLGPFAGALMVDGENSRSPRSGPASPDQTWLPQFELWSLPVRYGGTPVETVSLAEVARLEQRLAARIGGGE